MSLRHNTASSYACASLFDILQMWLLLSLFLTVLVPDTSQATNHAKAGMHVELRCLCVKTIPGIHPSHINSLQVIRAGAHCDKDEAIVTLKDGKKICLDPEVPVIKKIIQKILQKQ